ncbi:MAG TPA: BlaI/MecI/CopY family transcriptional regulator [Pirellulales bacterium]|nr:BlaI/MecI/CopY family transcriptional regulator [Pirellulales bacterium]
MTPLPPLPKSELEIARLVWDLGQATVRQVADALPSDRKLDFFTVQTYLRRLAAKGYLAVEREGRANVYRPRVRPKRVLKEIVDSFLNQAFQGQAMPLVQHLVEEHRLSEQEIVELKQALDRLSE